MSDTDLIDGKQALLADKLLSRPICLLGSISCLGEPVEISAIDWQPELLERMFAGFRSKNASGVMGMYELQFWAGLKVLANNKTGPVRVPASEGERFAKSLELSSPPTQSGTSIQTDLLDWLFSCKTRDWTLRA